MAPLSAKEQAFLQLLLAAREVGEAQAQEMLERVRRSESGGALPHDLHSAFKRINGALQPMNLGVRTAALPGHQEHVHAVVDLVRAWGSLP